MINVVENKYEKLLNEGEPQVYYFGSFDEQQIQNILKKIDNSIANYKKSIKRRIFYVSVELLQNVYHHAVKTTNNGQSLNLMMFVFLKLNDEKIKITCGNFVNKKKFNTIVSRIEQLNMLSEDEVRVLYKRVLNNQEFSEKGGGGLGMIDVKRKSTYPFEYDYIILNKNLYFFNFSVFLKNKN